MRLSRRSFLLIPVALGAASIPLLRENKKEEKPQTIANTLEKMNTSKEGRQDAWRRITIYVPSNDKVLLAEVDEQIKDFYSRYYLNKELTQIQIKTPDDRGEMFIPGKENMLDSMHMYESFPNGIVIVGTYSGSGYDMEVEGLKFSLKTTGIVW